MTNKIITTLLSPYAEETRFLKSFQLNENIGKGTFNVNSNFYCITKNPVHHFTAVELQICLNQLLYVYFAHLGLFDSYFNHFTNDEFIKKLNENNFIIEQSTCFKKNIDSSSIIQGEIEVISTKRIKGVKFMECIFSFSENCKGIVKVAHKE